MSTRPTPSASRASKPTWREAYEAFVKWRESAANYSADEQLVFDHARMEGVDEWSATGFSAGYMVAAAKYAPKKRRSK